MTLIRLSDWPERLAAYLHANANVPFAWGTHDCATFAIGAIHALTGVWIEVDALNHYHSSKQALRLIDAASIERRVVHVLGEPIPPTYARRGDLLTYQNSEHGSALAVCNGTHFVAPGDAGLESMAMDRAVCAWRVG